MFHFLVTHPIPVIVFLSLLAIIFGISKYLGEPVFSSARTRPDDDDDLSPWAGGPTGVSIGIEDIGKMGKQMCTTRDA
ncbi:MAG: hypothetical protein KKH12_10830 [Gammaproteobacteria bacterium]|nr:hypothetical protein [Gammaproteobacteria bacterium]MBU1482151.1 hypothetical protein [Gammaproteobacteria bacterium]